MKPNIQEQKEIAPEYGRIPHLVGKSNVYDAGDIEVDAKFDGNFMYVQEKVDGANCGVSWLDGPVLRNRKHVLHKGYEKDTPAKKQFVPAWNWLHDHEDDLQDVMKRWQSQVTIYGEWMWAKHSLEYDLLPDYFLAYDIYSPKDRKFISPSICRTLLSKTGIHWIDAELMQVKSFDDIRAILDRPSQYRTGMREGIVVKKYDTTGTWLDPASTFKIVRSDFVRADADWTKEELVRNKLFKNLPNL